MRTYDQLVTDIIHAIPNGEELDSLTDEQKETLRKYGNALDNALYMSTKKGRERIDAALKS